MLILYISYWWLYCQCEYQSPFITLNLQCRYFIKQPAAHRDILVPPVISHAHLVPLAAGVLEIVLWIVT